MESSVVMRKPAEILDEDHELVIEALCAILGRSYEELRLAAE